MNSSDECSGIVGAWDSEDGPPFEDYEPEIWEEIQKFFKKRAKENKPVIDFEILKFTKNFNDLVIKCYDDDDDEGFNILMNNINEMVEENYEGKYIRMYRGEAKPELPEGYMSEENRQKLLDIANKTYLKKNKKTQQVEKTPLPLGAITPNTQMSKNKTKIIKSLEQLLQLTKSGKLYGIGVPTFIKKRPFTSLYYLYILNKHHNDCLIINKDTGVSEIYYRNDQLIFPIPEEQYFKAVKKCKNAGIRFSVSYLALPPGSDGRSGHANAIVIDNVKNTLERYEPHGAGTFSANNRVNKELANVCKKYGYTFIEPVDLCPRFPQFNNFVNKGLQSFENLIKAEEGGYCVAHSYFYLDLRLTFPDEDPQQLLTDSVILFREPEICLKFIRAYAETLQAFIFSVIENHPEKAKILSNAYFKNLMERAETDPRTESEYHWIKNLILDYMKEAAGKSVIFKENTEEEIKNEIEDLEE
jgi:hypothetical protein